MENTMKRKKLIFIPVLIYILFITVNFSFDQKDSKKSPRKLEAGHKIQSIIKDRFHRSPRSQYAADQVLIKFKSRTTHSQISSALSFYRVKPLRQIPGIDVFQVQIPSDLTVKEMLSVLKNNPDVLYAEPNYKTRILATPNDTLFQYQYALHNTGQVIGSVPGSPQGQNLADINAPEAWEESKGNQDIVIAVIDSGVDFDHLDLSEKIISRGRDFVNDDWDATDDFYHGTFISGIIAADTNNQEGIAGVSWNCKILPIKVIDDDGTGLYTWMIEAIIWATDQGVDIINMSIGGDEPSDALKDALEDAYQEGVIIAAAAGNDTGPVIYPAAYDDYVLAVAATDYNDTRITWSNFGPQIDVAAPGKRILSCVPTWYFAQGSLPYGYGSGTSASVSHVSGLAALIKSIKPWLSPKEIMNIIRYTADDINQDEHPGLDEYIGYGRINMEKALVPVNIR
jgi:subtilisin family serine protease